MIMTNLDCHEFSLYNQFNFNYFAIQINISSHRVSFEQKIWGQGLREIRGLWSGTI